MIKQLHFSIQGQPECRLDSELSVKLHGYLMNRIPQELAAAYHSNALRPYALYLCPAASDGTQIGLLSILREDAAVIAEELTAAKHIPIGGMKTPLRCTVQESEQYYLRDVVQVLTGNRLRLRFLSPAVYKLNSQPCCFPDLPRLFHSVLEKMALFEGVVVSEEAFRQALAALRITDWQLSHSPFLITGRSQQGMHGMIECILPQDEALSRLIKTVFVYAQFCGVGARTAMGMGGVQIESIVSRV